MEFPTHVTVWFCRESGDAEVASGYADDEFDDGECPSCGGELVKAEYRLVNPAGEESK